MVDEVMFYATREEDAYVLECVAWEDYYELKQKYADLQLMYDKQCDQSYEDKNTIETLNYRLIQ